MTILIMVIALLPLNGLMQTQVLDDSRTKVGYVGPPLMRISHSDVVER